MMMFLVGDDSRVTKIESESALGWQEATGLQDGQRDDR